MRIAVTYENGSIFQHFGHTEQFKLYDIQEMQIVKEQIIDASGSGHGALAGFLTENGVDTLICGGIGGGARAALMEAGILLYPGVVGGADQAVEAYLNGTLAYVPDMVCSHHSHGGGHDCGSHGCGGHDHSCGGHCGG